MFHYRMAGPMLFHLHSRPGSPAYGIWAYRKAHPMLPWFIFPVKTQHSRHASSFSHISYFPHFCWSPLVPQPPILCAFQVIVPGLVAMNASSVLSTWVLARGGWPHGLRPGAWRQSISPFISAFRLSFQHFAWVCPKMFCVPKKPNGFADHYPYEKWLFHWGYTLFSDKPASILPLFYGRSFFFNMRLHVASLIYKRIFRLEEFRSHDAAVIQVCCTSMCVLALKHQGL